MKLNLTKKEIKFITYYLNYDYYNGMFDNEKEYDIINWIKCCAKHEIEYLNDNLMDKEDIVLNKKELERLIEKLEED